MASRCCICGNKIGFGDVERKFNLVLLPDAQLCRDCYKEINFLRNRLVKKAGGADAFLELRNSLEQKASASKGDARACDAALLLVEGLSLEKERFPEESSYLFYPHFLVNRDTEIFATLINGWRMGPPHGFAELIDYDVLVNGDTATSGSVAGAAIGALVDGAAGAVVGSAIASKSKNYLKQLDITLTFQDLESPMEVMHLVGESIPEESANYAKTIRLGERIIYVLKQIMYFNRRRIVSEERRLHATYAVSIADEIRKFDELAKDGVITREEFEKQKTKLLSLEY